MRKNIIYNLLKKASIAAVLGILIISSCKEAPTDAEELVARISGTVVSRATGNAIAGALVSTTPSLTSTTTDNNGGYELKGMSAGTYMLTATKSGYNSASVTVTVEEGKTVRGDIQMNEEGPEIEVQPTVIDLGASQTTATFSVLNTGVGTLNFSLIKNAAWMSVSPASGSVTNLPVTVTVTVDRSQVGYGNYNDVIQVTSNGGNKQVNVTMTKQDPNAPALNVSPMQLDFGSSVSTMQLNITNTGAGTLNWTVTKDQSWINVTPGLGTNAGTVTVTVSRTGLPGGQNFSGNVTLASNGGTRIVPVSMSTGTAYTGTWTTMTPYLEGINPQSNSILAVVNSSNIWAAGDKIWKYNGTSWVEQTKPENTGRIVSISFISPSEGYAVSQNSVLKYDGTNWTKLSYFNYGTYSYGIVLKPGVVFIFGFSYVYKSFNGGQTWQVENINTIANDGARTASKTSDGNNLFVCFGFGTTYKYDGLSWHFLYDAHIVGNGLPYMRYNLSVVNTTNVWLSTQFFGIEKYNGTSFQPEISFTGTTELYTVSMISETSGWAGGSKLYQYNGTGWTAKTGALSAAVIAIKMLSENEGYAVTEAGTILKYQ